MVQIRNQKVDNISNGKKMKIQNNKVCILCRLKDNVMRNQCPEQILHFGKAIQLYIYICVFSYIYIHMGKQSLETICLLLAYKIKYLKNFFFLEETTNVYNIKLWKIFTDCFNCLLIAAIVDEKIFCCHGDQGFLCDLLWSDPEEVVLGWGENDRGVSFTFGAEMVAKFLHKHDMNLPQVYIPPTLTTSSIPPALFTTTMGKSPTVSYKTN
ncbi:hypothetical protein ABFV05_020165 [Capra hircus]